MSRTIDNPYPDLDQPQPLQPERSQGDVIEGQEGPRPIRIPDQPLQLPDQPKS